MRKLIALSLLAVFIPALAADRTYPVSGYVFKKTKGIVAKHVTEQSGESAEMKLNYFVCIQRNPETDTYADNWLVYRQCWDTTKEVFDAVEVCDWFMVVTEHDKKQGLSDEKYAKQRKSDAKAIKADKMCKP